jgi:hypothetical protein
VFGRPGLVPKFGEWKSGYQICPCKLPISHPPSLYPPPFVDTIPTSPHHAHQRALSSPTRPVQDQHPARRPTAPLLNRPAGASVNQIHPVNSPHPLLLPTLRTGCDQRLHRLQSISAQGFDLSRQGRAQHLTFSRPRRVLHSFARGSSRIDPRSNQAFAH